MSEHRHEWRMTKIACECGKELEEHRIRDLDQQHRDLLKETEMLSQAVDKRNQRLTKLEAVVEKARELLSLFHSDKFIKGSSLTQLKEAIQALTPGEGE